MWRPHLGCLARLFDLAGVVLRQLLPAGDGADTKPGLVVVGDEWKMASQLDDARQLTPVLAGAADCFGGWFIDCEHADIIDRICRKPPARLRANALAGAS